MAGSFAVELAKTLDVLERDCRFLLDLIFRIHGFDSGEVKHGVEQHRGMAVRKYEAVTIWPDWICRVEAQELLPQNVSHGRERHRRDRNARVGLLYRID